MPRRSGHSLGPAGRHAGRPPGPTHVSADTTIHTSPSQRSAGPHSVCTWGGSPGPSAEWGARLTQSWRGDFYLFHSDQFGERCKREQRREAVASVDRAEPLRPSLGVTFTRPRTVLSPQRIPNENTGRHLFTA